MADFNHNHASLILKWMLSSPLFTTEFNSFSVNFNFRGWLLIYSLFLFRTFRNFVTNSRSTRGEMNSSGNAFDSVSYVYYPKSIFSFSIVRIFSAFNLCSECECFPNEFELKQTNERTIYSFYGIFFVHSFSILYSTASWLNNKISIWLWLNQHKCVSRGIVFVCMNEQLKQH